MTTSAEIETGVLDALADLIAFGTNEIGESIGAWDVRSDAESVAFTTDLGGIRRRYVLTQTARYREALEFIAAQVCLGRGNNQPCDLNESPDPDEWCLVHVARDALGMPRTSPRTDDVGANR